LREGSLDERAHAAKDLAKTSTPDVVQALARALEDGEFTLHRNTRVAPVRDAAEHSLVKLGAVAVEPLTAELGHEQPDVRQRAARCLGHIGDGRAAGPLVAALLTSDASVRPVMIDALSRMRPPAAAELHAAAALEAARSYRLAILGEALAVIGDKAAVNVLLDALDAGDVDARKHAAYALAKCSGRDAVEPLMQALKDAEAPLSKALNDRDPELRGLAEQSLVSLRKTTNEPFLGQTFPVGLGPATSPARTPTVPMTSGPVLQMSLVRFDDDVMLDIERARQKLAEHGLRPANVRELHAFSAAYPGMQFEHHIYEIGQSSLDRHGKTAYLYLWGIPATVLSAGVKGMGGADAKESWTPFDRVPLSENHRYLLAAPAGSENLA
jgi:bilin biosynthesis protein